MISAKSNVFLFYVCCVLDVQKCLSNYTILFEQFYKNTKLIFAQNLRTN